MPSWGIRGGKMLPYCKPASSGFGLPLAIILSVATELALSPSG